MEPVGHFVSRMIVLPVLYLVLGAIFTWPARLGDPLRLRRRDGSHWHPRPEPSAEPLESARKMY